MKRKVIRFSLAFLVCLLPLIVLGQSFSFYDKINTYNRMEFSASTAGENPVNLSLFNTNSGTDNVSQYVKYKWPFLGTEYQEQTYLYADITVYSSIPVPSGLQWNIKATATSSGNYGTSTDFQALSTTTITLIDNIWSTAPSGWLVWVSFLAANISNTLTQVLSVTNFADIHPTPNGAYQTITLYYSLE